MRGLLRHVTLGAVLLALCLGTAGAATGKLEDLLWDLQIIPLDGKTPPPFSLERLDGKRVDLKDLRGRPALLYFWATW
ncbi:MAG: redoxin domain-containing protein [Candidatus Rokubacteria bacterium]|nr:redoxin domain-containing protein [Candidatus Rokubacteria bacterium]